MNGHHQHDLTPWGCGKTRLTFTLLQNHVSVIFIELFVNNNLKLPFQEKAMMLASAHGSFQRGLEIDLAETLVTGAAEN